MSGAEDGRLEPRLRNYIQHLQTKYSIPAIAVSLASGESEGFGGNVPSGPVTSRTVFQLCSNTKLITAVALGVLVEQGKLKFQDRVKDILPGFSCLNKRTEALVRVEDLLCHRLGSLPLFAGSLHVDWLEDDYPKRFSQLRFKGDLYDGFDYTNATYSLAGCIIRHVSCMPYVNFVERYIVKPLGMDDSTFDVQSTRVVTPMLSHADGKLDIIDSNFLKLPKYHANHPAGGLLTTAEDMSKWLAWLLKATQEHDSALPTQPSILKPDTLQTIIKPRVVCPWQGGFGVDSNRSSASAEFSTPTYALGVQRYHFRGIDCVGHGGDHPGSGTYTMWCPGLDFGITVLTNIEAKGNDVGYLIMLRALELHFGFPQGKWEELMYKEPHRFQGTQASFPVVAHAQPANVPWQRMLGRFESGPLAPLHIFRPDSSLDQLAHENPRRVLAQRQRARRVGASRASSDPPLLLGCLENDTLFGSYFSIWHVTGDVYWADIHLLMQPDMSGEWIDANRATILYADKGSLLTVHAADDGGLSIEFSAGWQDAVQGVELGHGNLTWTQIFPP